MYCCGLMLEVPEHAIYTVKLQILAILANGIKTLILIPANNYNQSRGRTR